MQVQLYHKWRCPYSARVRDFVDEHGLGDKIEYVEVTEIEGADRKLNELTLTSQVPCLVVDGRPMLESAEIVQWLEQNLVSRPGQAH